MKFVISTSTLNQILQKLQNIVPQKATIPILSNLMIEAINDELIITATDLTVGMRCFNEAKIMEEGATTLPARYFSSLIRELTVPHVEISSNPNEVTEINANASRFKLNGMSRKEFPSLPDLTDAISFKIEQHLLKDMFFRTSFTVPREDTRFVLTGVCLQIHDGKAFFSGTDGKRLARAHTAISVDKGIHGSYIIPLKAVEEIQKNLRNDGQATVYLMADKIAVDANGALLISKLLSGEYPDVSRVIPQEFKTRVILHREELISLLRQVSLFTTDTTQSICCTFSNGELRLKSNVMEVGEGKVSMPVNYAGPTLEIAFHPGSFLDILRHCKEETVTLGLTDAYTPGVFTDGEALFESIMDASPLFVLMPMRLSED